MFMAIAVESPRHPRNRADYKVWYLVLDDNHEVIGLGVKTKDEVIQSLFESYRKTGRSNWRAFLKGSERSREIDLTDFIAQNMFENTHFGNLPSLAEFQETLTRLSLNLELRIVA